MNTLKLAAMFFYKKAIITFIIVIELAVLFLIENYMVCTIESRAMLVKPYEGILGENSIIVSDIWYDFKLNESVASGSDTPLTVKESQEGLLKKLKGNYKVYDFLVFYNPDYSDYVVYSVDDEIYKALALPLVSGSYGSAPNSAVASSKAGRGSIKINTPGGTLDLDICGTLTSNTYVPENTHRSADMTINDLYSVNDKGNVIITGRSALGEVEKSFSSKLTFIVSFDTPEAAEEGISCLGSDAMTISGSTVVRNTKTILYDDLRGFIPLVCCVLFIVLIGIISISIMIFNENRYRNGVLWLCGYSRKRITACQAASIGIILILSLLVFTMVTIVYNSLLSGGIIDADSYLKIEFGFGNLTLTLLTCIVLIGAAIAIPAAKTYKKSPVEYLGRAK